MAAAAAGSALDGATQCESIRDELYSEPAGLAPALDRRVHDAGSHRRRLPLCERLDRGGGQVADELRQVRAAMHAAQALLDRAAEAVREIRADELPVGGLDAVASVRVGAAGMLASTAWIVNARSIVTRIHMSCTGSPGARTPVISANGRDLVSRSRASRSNSPSARW